MSLKQLVLGMTSEARKELVELIEWMEAKEAELASEIAIEVSKSKESAPEVEAPEVEAPVAEAPVAEAAPEDTEAPVA